MVVGAKKYDLIVDSAGGGDFLTIQEAINAAEPGARILVRGHHRLEKPLEPRDDAPVEIIGGDIEVE